jgi:AcrR family transcriptional regulator
MATTSAKKSETKQARAPSSRLRRGRRLEPEERRGEILDAAFALFAKKGYGATRIDDIARQARVAKGLVLFHFKTKENVFQAVVRRAIPPLLDRLEASDGNDGRPGAEQLGDALRQVYRYMVENPRTRVILQLLVAEGRRFPKLRSFYHAEVVQRGNAAISAIVARGVARGEFTLPAAAASSAGDVTRIFLAPVISALFWQILFAEIDRIDVEHLFQTHLALALDGLRGAR